MGPFFFEVDRHCSKNNSERYPNMVNEFVLDELVDIDLDELQFQLRENLFGRI